MTALRAHGLKSLRARIALPFTLLVMLAILAPGFIAVHQAVHTLTSKAEQTQLLAAQMAANYLAYLLRDQIATVQGIAQLEALRKMAPARIDAEIKEVRLHEKAFTSLIVIDPGGKIVSFVNKPWNVGQSLAPREYFQIALHQGRTYISDSILTLDKTITVVVSTPIRNDRGQIVGVLAGTFNVHHKNFNAVILDTKIGTAGYAYLVDQRGIVITHPQAQRSLEQANFSHYSVVREVLAGKSGVGLYDCEGTEMLAAYAPVEPSGWGVIVQQPLAAANAPAIDLRHFFLTVVLVSAGIAAFLGVFIAHRIAVPLSRLESSAATIATGNLEEPVPALGHDEIGRLAVTFDEMRLSLKESRRQLEKANENFRVLLDATPAAVLLLDPEGIVMAANEIAATRLGKTLSEIMGTDIFSHLPPDLAETRKARLEEMKRSGRPIHFEDIDNNCHLDNYVHPIFTPAGDLACLAVLSVDITDRKRAEAVLATTKAQLEKTFAVMGEMVLLVDPATRTITACNPAVQDIFGYCPEEVVGRNTEFLHVDRAAYEEFGRRLFQALDQDGRAAFEFQMKRQDGSLIPCEHSVTEILDEAGRRTHMVGIIRDISERQQAEAALRQSEAHLREAQRIAHIGSWSMNLADNIIRWSDEMYRLYGVTKEEFPHTVDSLLQLLHPDDRPLLQRWIEQAIANLKPLELDFRIIRPDGTIRYIRGSGDLFTDPAGQPERIAGTAQDITERKRAEENIRQRTAELTALNALAHRVGTGLSLEEVTAAALDHPLYPSQPDLAMFYLREDDRLVFQKARPDLAALSEQEAQLRMGECLCGLALEEGKAVYSSNIHVDPRCTLPACKEAGMRSFAALPLLSGERILGVLGLAWVEAQDPKARAEFLETSAGEIAMGLHNALLYQQLQQHADQLDCRVRERTVQVQAANKELEAFAYSISHDLRAPLRAISGFAQIIARRHRAALNEEGQRYFDNIVLAAERMSHLIDDLLAFSRLGRKALTPRPVDLGEILEQVCRELADRVAAAGASLQVAQDLPAIPGDPTLLGQAFTNLLDNALTYRRPGVAPEIRVSWSMEDGRIVLAVADNGIGIAPEYQEKIFNVFQRLHSDEDYPGTGIGLAIVKKAAEMLGGQVWVESMVDQGSTFYVKLPKE